MLLYERMRGWKLYRSILFIPYILAVPIVASITGHGVDTIVEWIQRDLAKVAVNMAQAVLTDTKPEINNTKDYNNGKKIVPSFLLEPVVVIKDNIKTALVDAGYYKQSDIDG